jgi:8-oxo-dGTP pyrophosphatase MutT (NUDIX family)
MLDNLVGGGVTAGLTQFQVLVKEAWEEAGISAALAQKATPGGTISVLREVAEGVQSEIISIYDLELPKDFQPQNQDGEVSEFQLLAFPAVERERLTYEAELVARDYFKRRATAAKAP